MTDPEVIDNQAKSRLEIHAEGQVAELIYRLRPGRLVIIHTGVPDALSGHGLGSELVQAAVDKAAAGGLTVVPLCPYARGWLQRHQDQAAKVQIDWTA